MKLLEIKTAIEYIPVGKEDLKVRVEHYIIDELDDREYHALLELTKGQAR